MLAAARMSSHSVGECEGGDGIAPLPTLHRSRSVGRSLLSRFSRGGEETSSPTGLVFRSFQQQQQQLQVAAAAVGSEALAAAAAAEAGSSAAGEGSSDGWQQMRGRRATAYGDE
jgi:hypothetical protein